MTTSESGREAFRQDGSTVEKVMDTRLIGSGRSGQSVKPAFIAVCLLGLFGLVGCVGGEPSGAQSTLGTPDAEPLGTLAEDAWVEAPPDCEGLLTNSVSFRVASLSAGLVACVDSAGEVICVDSVEAISSDLDESGRDEEAEALAAGFFAAVHAEEMAVEISDMASDPEPQPNSRPRGIGDPEPQPN